MITFEDYLETDTRKLSSEQLAVVYSDVATIVSAGAGSGKTTVLSYRFLRLLMEHKAHVDEILTLTFTRKAASEMYERIFRLVEKVSLLNPDLKEEAKNFASSSISTLDSFASEIARTDSARYGVSRNFEIIDKEDEEELYRRIAFSFLDDAGEDVLNLSRFFSPSQFWELFADVATRFNILTSSDEEEYEEGYRKFLETLLDGICSELQRLMIEVGEYDRAGAESKPWFSPDSNTYYKTIKKLAELRQVDELPQDINLKGGAKPFTKEEWGDIKRLYSTARDLISYIDVVRENLAAKDMTHSVARVFSSFVEHLQSEKRRMGVLCFSDVEALALEILKSNRDVRAFYKKKFRYIMIDEFQDNSRRQRDLLFILSEREDLDGTGVPEKEDLDKTKLFFVGDDKQSIYLFRNADVAVFNALKNDIVAIGGKHLTMSTNYRSNPELLRHFNNIFKSVLDGSHETEATEEFEENLMEKLLGRDDLSGYEAIFEPIGGADNPDRCKSRVVFSESMNPEKLDAETSMEGRLSKEENEAEHILKLVRSMTETDEYLIPADRNGNLRRPTFDDIAVLYQKSASQMPLEKTFRREGLPYTVVSSTSITLEALSADIIAFLKLVLYPGDKVSYFQVLRSPFVRLSDEALSFYTRYREAYLLPEGERAFEYIPEGIDEDDRLKLEKAGELYRKIVSLAGRAPLTVILDTLYYEGGYSAFLKSNVGLYPYEEHYQYLWETAKDMETVVEFVSHLEERMKQVSKFDVDILRLKSTGVKMMTIHKSKGLEFPIVILAGSGSWRSRNDTSRVVTYEGAPFIALDAAGDSGINKLFRAWKSRRLLAEKKRLLYVALTRAETHLVVVASGEYSAKLGYHYNEKSMAWFYQKGLENDSIHTGKEFPLLTENDIDKSKEGSSVFEEFYDRPVAARGNFTRHKYGAKELAHIEQERDVEVESEKGEYIPGMDKDVEHMILSNGLSPDFGTFVHALFETHFNEDITPVFSSEKLSSKDCSLVDHEGRRMEKEFFETELYRKEVATALKVIPEEGFVSLDGDVVVEGSIDLLVLKEKYNLVIDYKTDRYLQPKDHEGQMKSYIEAVENLYPGRPCYAVLYYVRDHHFEKAIDRDGLPIELG